MSTPNPIDAQRASASNRRLLWFPAVVLALSLIGLIFAGVQLVRSTPEPSAVATDRPALESGLNAERTGGIAFGSATPDPNVEAATIVADTATAMGAVTSVEFAVARTGAPVYIDQFESIALDDLVGQFETPANAQAVIEVTIDDVNRTQLGAVALGQEVWVSNPVTGQFETLPAGYDLDPSRFFDPRGGWQPLFEHLTDVTLIGIDQRDGVDTYHLRGLAAAADVTNITVGLIRNQDVPVDVWIDPGTSLVMYADFTTQLGDATSNWSLRLTEYGADFTINPPPDVATPEPEDDPDGDGQ